MGNAFFMSSIDIPCEKKYIYNLATEMAANTMSSKLKQNKPLGEQWEDLASLEIPALLFGLHFPKAVKMSKTS